MGLAPEVKQQLLVKCKATARTWHAKVPTSHNLAVFSDDLTRARTLRPTPRCRPAPTYYFTPRQFVNAIMAPHLNTMKMGVTIVISAWDDATRVPHQKGAEQKKRDAPTAGSTTESKGRYPEGTTMNDLGLLLPGSEHHESIDLTRLVSTRSMRPVYIGFMRDHLSRNYAEIFPPGCAFVLDHFADGPILFTSKGFMCLENLRHPFGEADMMSLFWCRVLRHMDVYINTIDGDLCLLLLNYVDRHATPNKIYYNWVKTETRQSKDKRAVDGELKVKCEGYVDIKDMHAAIGPRLFAFTLACVMCKTDYHEKSSLIKGIGSDTVLGWGLKPHPPLESMGEGAQHAHKWDFTGLLKDVDNLWTYPLASPRVMPHYRAISAETKGTHPTQEQLTGADSTAVTRELERALLSIRAYAEKKKGGVEYTTRGAKSLGFNLQYWLVDLNAITWHLGDRAARVRILGEIKGDDEEKKSIEEGPSFGIIRGS
jgi:hypothetical protein